MVVVPKVTDMTVYPVAGYDSMLLTLSGAHYPYFTRNIIVLTDDAGHTGIGEIHGGDAITQALDKYRPLVIGSKITEYRKVLNQIRQSESYHENNNGEGLQQLDLANLKYVVHAEAAIECALLDLCGKFVNLPMCDLIG